MSTEIARFVTSAQAYHTVIAQGNADGTLRLAITRNGVPWVTDVKEMSLILQGHEVHGLCSTEEGVKGSFNTTPVVSVSYGEVVK